MDISKMDKPKTTPTLPHVEQIKTKPEDSPFDCFGCSS
jgi:hypothetical protein